MIETKTCYRCGVEKELSSKSFNARNDSKDGYRNSCKKCDNDRAKKHYKENKEEKREYQNNYYLKNRDKFLVDFKKWRTNNQDYINEYNDAYYQKNKERLKLKSRLYIKTPRGRVVDRMANQRREARKRRLINTLTRVEWKESKATFNNTCAYCGDDKELQQDHIIPLSKDGAYNKQNILPACKPCNVSKSARDMEKWYKDQSFYDENKLNKIHKWMGLKNNIQQLTLL